MKKQIQKSRETVPLNLKLQVQLKIKENSVIPFTNMGEIYILSIRYWCVLFSAFLAELFVFISLAPSGDPQGPVLQHMVQQISLHSPGQPGVLFCPTQYLHM